jgi:antitoxin HigA-1
MEQELAKNRMRPIHPGEILREEFLVPSGLSVNALAQALHVPATRLHEIVKERRSITADTALRLARYFGGDPQSWLNLQTRYDLRRAVLAVGDRIEREVVPRSHVRRRAASGR